MEDKKQIICAAALEILRESPNPAIITVSEIAKRCGIGKGTIYEYYKSKEEIILSSLLLYIDMAKASLSSIPQDGSFRNDFIMMYKYIDSKFQFFNSVIPLLVNNNSLECYLGPKLHAQTKERINNIYAEIEKLLNSLMEKGINEGVIRPAKNDTERKITNQLIMISFVMYRQEISPFTEIDFEEYVDICCDKFIDMLNA